MPAYPPDDDAIPLPAAQSTLIGHEAAEKEMVDALSARMHHAWLITGIKGIGKATLAYRFARKILADAHDGPSDGMGLFGDEPEPMTSLAVSPDHAVFSRIGTGAHGDLNIIERKADLKTGKMREEIPVDDIRRLIHFFALTGAETGWRIAIVDAVDELNRNAANALLKILEEPPKNALLLLVAHRPGRLLPTIRSRCRRLALSPLPSNLVEDYLAQNMPNMDAVDRHSVAAMAEGSIGKALGLCSDDGVSVLSDFNQLTAKLADISAKDIHGFAGKLTGRDAGDKYRIFQDLFRGWISSHTREEASRQATSPHLDRWFELWEKVSHLNERTDAVYLDRKQVVISLLLSAQTVLRQH